jgi:hypothetical protein
MAVLKLDIVVGDDGAVQKLKEINDQIKQTESSGDQHRAAIDKIKDSYKEAFGLTESNAKSTTTYANALKAASTESLKVSSATATLGQSHAAQTAAVKVSSAAYVEQQMAMWKAQGAAAALSAESKIAAESQVAMAGASEAVTATSIGAYAAITATVGALVLLATAAGAALGFLYESSKAYIVQSGILDDHKAAIDRVKKAWEDMFFLVGQRVVGSGADANFWIDGLTVAITYITMKIEEAIDAWRTFRNLVTLGGPSTDAPIYSLLFGAEAPTPQNARKDVNGDLTAYGSLKSAQERQAADIARNRIQPIDAERAQKEFDEGERVRLAALKAAQRDAEAWQKVNDTISGKASIDSANDWMKHLKDVGGLTNITEKATKDLSNTLENAISVYARMGQVAPKAMMDTYFATLQAQHAVQNGIDAAKHNVLPGFVAPRSLEIPVPNMGFSSGIAGDTLPGSVPSVYANGMAAVAAPLAKLSVSPFRIAFEQFGKELPDLLFSALKSGSVGGFIGGIAAGLGSIFNEQFSSALAKVGGDMSKLGGSATALGVAGMGISSAIGGYQLGQQYGKGKGALAGAAGGAMAGVPFAAATGGASILIGAGIGALAGFFGGRSADKKAKQAMEDDRAAMLAQYGGMEKLKSLAESLGVSIGNAFSTTKPAQFKSFVDSLNTALEKQKNTLEGIGKITEGTNARAKNVSTQGDVDVVGAGAIASFGLQIQNGVSALTAFATLQPAITAIQGAMTGTNIAVSESVTKFLQLGSVLEANRVPFENLAADGQIMQGMMQGNIRDFDLFRAIAADIGVQLQGMIDRGVPTAQVFALAQPQLQALWEAQQKWHFELDGTTQALLNQAVTQGFVGESMKSINQQILDVLVAIGHVLGADIPNALASLPQAAANAANGMNAAFVNVKAPNITGDYAAEPPDVEGFASGGWIKARPGGTLIRVGEGGEDELITPKSKLGGGGIVVNVYADTVVGESEYLQTTVTAAVVEAIRLNKNSAFTKAHAALGTS